MKGPRLLVSEQVQAEKHRLPGETFEQACTRIADAYSDTAEHRLHLMDALMDQKFIPAGRIQRAAGQLHNVTPYNCYVAPDIEDSFVDGENSIMAVAHKAATTMRMGGGIGYNFGTLRPKGALIKKLGSRSSGPVSFMDIFDAVCRCTASAGDRRGAQMGVMPVWHPDIIEFIEAKANDTRLKGFNISVGVTDKFMEAVDWGLPFDLVWQGEVYRTIDAAELWDKMMLQNYDWAEPGVLFLDTINRLNNLNYCETITATNPCGEQPLPPNGACLLGSINIVKFVRADERGQRSVDLVGLRETVATAVRALDNVVDRAIYPLPEQRSEALSKRRMGLGVMGMANALEACGETYGSKGYLFMQSVVLSTINAAAYETSVKLAMEKGAFPLYDARWGGEGTFAHKAVPHLRADMRRHGIRNSHLTSIAPTGSISLAADNVSSGIEPVWAHHMNRKIIMAQGETWEDVEDYGTREFGVRGRLASEVSPLEHVDVLCGAQQWVDSAVSKTCNVSERVNFQDFKKIYLRAFQGGAKGCTTYREGNRRAGIFKRKEPEACFIDPKTGARSCE